MELLWLEVDSEQMEEPRRSDKEVAEADNDLVTTPEGIRIEPANLHCPSESNAEAIWKELRKFDKNDDGAIDEEELLAVIRKVVKLRRKTQRAWRVAGLGVLLGCLVAACMLGVVIWGIELGKDIETASDRSSEAQLSTSTLRDKSTGQIISVASASLNIEFNSNSETNLPTNPMEEAEEVALHFSAQRSQVLGSAFQTLAGTSTLTFGERLDLVKASDLEQMEAFSIYDSSGRSVAYSVTEYDFRRAGNFTILTASGVTISWANHQLHRTARDGTVELMHDESTAEGLAASISATQSRRFGSLSTAPAFSGSVRMRPEWSLEGFLPRGPQNMSAANFHNVDELSEFKASALVDCSRDNFLAHHNCDMEDRPSVSDSAWCRQWTVCTSTTTGYGGQELCGKYERRTPCDRTASTCRDPSTCGLMDEAGLHKCDYCFRKGTCFSGDSEVQLFDGNNKRMDDVVVGDELRCDSKDPCTVVGFLHRSTREEAAFIQIHMDNAERPLEVTAQHIVFEQAPDGMRRSIRADRVKVGSSLYSTNGVSRKVVAITHVLKKGYFSPLTDNDGTLVVNDVVASSYTSYDFTPSVVAENHDYIHMIFSPLRMFYAAQRSFFPQTWASSIEVVRDGEIHWYANALCSTIGGCPF